MDLHAKTRVELLELTHALGEKGANSLFLKVPGDQHTERKPARRRKCVERQGRIDALPQQVRSEARTRDDLLSERRGHLGVLSLLPPSQQKACERDTGKAPGNLLPDITGETVDMVLLVIVHRVPIAPTADGDRVAWHRGEAVVPVGVIEDIERSHIQTRRVQAGEELLGISDVAA